MLKLAAAAVLIHIMWFGMALTLDRAQMAGSGDPITKATAFMVFWIDFGVLGMLAIYLGVPA